MEQPDPYASPEADVERGAAASRADAVAGRSPWLTIWLQPRATIEAIVATDPARANYLLAMAMGVSQALDRASLRSAGDSLELPVILAAAIIGGPIAGILTLYLAAFLLVWTGRWLGGHATRPQVRAAVAWSSVPVVFALVLWPPELALFGAELFASETPRLDASPTLQLALAGFAFVDFIIGVWSLVLFLKCLGQVQGFSAWTALGNAILAVVAVVVPIVLLLLGVIAIAGLFA